MEKPTPIQISVDRPCSEKWQQFSHTLAGGYCTSCQTTVKDFTQLTDDQIIRYFRQPRGKVCGRFSSDQLKTYQPYAQSVTHGSNWFKWIVVSVMGIFVLLFRNPATAQKKVKPQTTQAPGQQDSEKNLLQQEEPITVRGIVIDDDKYPIPGANVILKGANIGTVTNLDGEFELKDLKEGDELAFCFIGFETLNFKISKKNLHLFDQPISLTLDCSVMGGVTVDEVYQSHEDQPKSLRRTLANWFTK